MSEKKQKYSILLSIAAPFWKISDNWMGFLKISSLFVLLLTFLSYLSQQTYICISGEASHCLSQSYLYFPYLLVKFLICSEFLALWNNSVFKKEPLDKEHVLASWKPALKVFAIFLIFVVALLLPLISFFILLARVPNPIWQIELLFFILVSLGFWTPFILMRFFATCAEFISGENWKNFKLIAQKTDGLGIKITFTTSFTFLIFAFMFSLFFAIFKTSVADVSALNIFISELAFNLLTLFVLTLWLNFMQKQKEILLDLE